MRSRGTPEQGRDLGSVLWALRWTQRLREQLVQCEAPHVLKVKDLKETGSQNLGHLRPGRVSASAGGRAPGPAGHGGRSAHLLVPLLAGRPLSGCPACEPPAVGATGARCAPPAAGRGPAPPPRCCWRSASCVTVLSRRPGGRAGPEGVASDCCLLPEAPQRRGPLSPTQEPCGVSCVCRVGPA